MGVYISIIGIAKNSAIVAQSIKFSHNAMNITKLVDPTAASVTLIKKIAIECLPPQIKYPVKCAIFAFQCYTVFAAALADENGFVMDYDTAYNLIKETYSGSIQITSEWQALKHIYHGTGVGVNPEDYGIPQQVNAH